MLLKAAMLLKIRCSSGEKYRNKDKDRARGCDQCPWNRKAKKDRYYLKKFSNRKKNRKCSKLIRVVAMAKWKEIEANLEFSTQTF